MQFLAWTGGKKTTLTNIYVAIKASRPHQSWVQGISPISAGYDNHVGAAVESCSNKAAQDVKDLAVGI